MRSRYDQDIAILTFHGRLGRHVNVTRREVTDCKIKLLPTALFKKQPPEYQQEILSDAKRLAVTDIMVTAHGDVGFYSDGWSQWFDVELEEGEWKYDGGGVELEVLRYDI